MKIKLGRVLRVAGRLIQAAPAIIEAISPVFRKRKPAPMDAEPVTQLPGSPHPAGTADIDKNA